MLIKKFLILLALMIFFAGCGNEEPPPEIKVEKNSTPDEALTFTHDGKISLSHELMIYSNVSGKVIEKYFKDGDEVEERQLLFKVGNADTESELLQAKANLGKLMTTLAREATQKKSVDELQAETAELQERIKLLEEESAAGIIYAPIAGQIDSGNLRLGKEIRANETVLAKIGRADPAVVRFEISAEEKNFLATNKPKVSLKFDDGTSYSREGTINLVNDTTAEATFDNPDGLLLLGKTVKIEFGKDRN